MHLSFTADDMSSVAPLIAVALWLVFGPASTVPAIHAAALVVISELVRRTISIRTSSNTSKPSVVLVHSPTQKGIGKKKPPPPRSREDNIVTPKSTKRNLDPAFESAITRLATQVKSGSQPSVYLKRADVALLVDKLIEQAKTPGVLCITSPALERLSLLDSNPNGRGVSTPTRNHSKARTRAQSLHLDRNILGEINAPDWGQTMSPRNPAKYLSEKQVRCGSSVSTGGDRVSSLPKENMLPISTSGSDRRCRSRGRRNTTSSFSLGELVQEEEPISPTGDKVQAPLSALGPGVGYWATEPSPVVESTAISAKLGEGDPKQEKVGRPLSRTPPRPLRRISLVERSTEGNKGDDFDEFWTVN
ncbi:unnamed protein product [Choristocarpus tenellus]